MTFNFRFLVKVFFWVLFKAKAPNVWFWLRRTVVLLGSYLLFLTVESGNWTGFLIDELLFPEYRDRKIETPVFIVGNPRSGTTFLQRLMARDAENFTCLKMWEILFAPSITQRKVVWSLADVDRIIGHPIKKIVDWIEVRILDSTKLHKVGIRSPEEDEYLLLHRASTIVPGLYFLAHDLAWPYIFFDRDIPQKEQTRVMDFYGACIRRHQRAHRTRKHFLSKNPYFTPKIGALAKAFPGAKFIVMVRNPLNVIPSYTSLSSYVLRILYGKNTEPNYDYILRATQHWYRHPQAQLADAPEDSYIFVNFDELVRDPHTTVAAIYARLGFEIEPAFEEILREATEKAKRYVSQHKYSVEEMGYTREQILTTYSDIFEQWGFDTGEE